MVKRGNKGQVTLFVIIAIIIVVLVAGGFFLYKENKTKSQNNVLTIKNYISDSIETEVLRNIITVAYQGGYAFPPIDSLSTPYYSVGYWVIDNETFYPSIEELASNIDFLNYMMGQANLSEVFPDYDLTKGNLESNTTILKDKVLVSINWPITIKKGNDIQTIENFNFQYNLRLGKLYDSAVYSADALSNYTIPDSLPADITLNIYLSNTNASLYELTDTNENFKIANQSFKFIFASK